MTMTTLRLSALAPLTLAVTLFGGSFVSSTSTQDGAAQEQPVIEDVVEEVTVLHENMEVLGKGMKSMRKMMRKPEMKADALALCGKMQHAAAISFMNAPEKVEGLEGTELLAYQADFKKRMLTVAGALVDLELALEKGDADAAKAVYRSLGAAKKEGHDIYIK